MLYTRLPISGDKSEGSHYGGGAGLSDVAGLTYFGAWFTDHFVPFIEGYGVTDLYTSSVSPFETQVERWVYWAKHMAVSRYDPPATEWYSDSGKEIPCHYHQR